MSGSGGGGMRVEFAVQFQRGRHGRKQAQPGVAPETPAVPGRIPRVSRLMALAIRFDDLVRRGEVRDFAEIARLGHVSRARVAQICNFLQLATDIQESLLALPPVENGGGEPSEQDLRSIIAEADWQQQRRLWRDLNGIC